MKEIVNSRHVQQVGAISVIVKTSRTFVFSSIVLPASQLSICFHFLVPWSVAESGGEMGH